MDFSKTVFVTDFDGTLLTTDKRISDADLRAIKRFRAQGGKFGIATGRPIQTTLRYLDDLPVDLPLIMYNGCIIYDYHRAEILYASYLPDVAKEILLDVRQEFKNISPEIFTFEGQYYFIMNAAEKWHHEILGVEYTKLDSHIQIIEPWCKMLFADEPDIISELEVYIRKFEGRGVHFVRSCPKFLEILPENTSKGSAIIELKRLCQLDRLTLVAAGDYDNDIEMLEAADISFCPSNSQECVKEKVTHVLDYSNDESAIAEAIEYLEKSK